MDIINHIISLLKKKDDNSLHAYNAIGDVNNGRTSHSCHNISQLRPYHVTKFKYEAQSAFVIKMEQTFETSFCTIREFHPYRSRDTHDYQGGEVVKLQCHKQYSKGSAYTVIWHILVVYIAYRIESCIIIRNCVDIQCHIICKEMTY